MINLLLGSIFYVVFKNILIPCDNSNTNRASNNAMEVSKQYDSNLRVYACLAVANLGGWYVNRRINKDIMKNVKCPVLIIK